MDMDEFTKFIDEQIKEVQAMPKLTPERIEELRREAQESPEIKQIKEETRRLQMIDSIFTHKEEEKKCQKMTD